MIAADPNLIDFLQYDNNKKVAFRGIKSNNSFKFKKLFTLNQVIISDPVVWMKTKYNIFFQIS